MLLHSADTTRQVYSRNRPPWSHWNGSVSAVASEQPRSFLVLTGCRPRLSSSPSVRSVELQGPPSLTPSVCDHLADVCVQTEDKTHSQVIKPVKNRAEYGSKWVGLCKKKLKEGNCVIGIEKQDIWGQRCPFLVPAVAFLYFSSSEFFLQVFKLLQYFNRTCWS